MEQLMRFCRDLLTSLSSQHRHTLTPDESADLDAALSSISKELNTCSVMSAVERFPKLPSLLVGLCAVDSIVANHTDRLLGCILSNAYTGANDGAAVDPQVQRVQSKALAWSTKLSYSVSRMPYRLAAADEMLVSMGYSDEGHNMAVDSEIVDSVMRQIHLISTGIIQTKDGLDGNTFLSNQPMTAHQQALQELQQLPPSDHESTHLPVQLALLESSLRTVDTIPRSRVVAQQIYKQLKDAKNVKIPSHIMSNLWAVLPHTFDDMVMDLIDSVTSSLYIPIISVTSTVQPLIRTFQRQPYLIFSIFETLRELYFSVNDPRVASLITLLTATVVQEYIYSKVPPSVPFYRLFAESLRELVTLFLSSPSPTTVASVSHLLKRLVTDGRREVIEEVWFLLIRFDWWINFVLIQLLQDSSLQHQTDYLFLVRFRYDPFSTALCLDTLSSIIKLFDEHSGVIVNQQPSSGSMSLFIEALRNFRSELKSSVSRFVLRDLLIRTLYLTKHRNTSRAVVQFLLDVQQDEAEILLAFFHLTEFLQWVSLTSIISVETDAYNSQNGLLYQTVRVYGQSFNCIRMGHVCDTEGIIDMLNNLPTHDAYPWSKDAKRSIESLRIDLLNLREQDGGTRRR
eukprot:GILJ01013894.1.p1 GENE.GILJ01013894.1~~GILJ01013894.1.p1  ORF type:complete len:637 (-),score=80.35 GILJ01013894.1:435-2312(-)